MDAGSFKLAFIVPGGLGNKTDAAATDDTPYTSPREEGTDYSAHSNEMTANPHDTT